MTTAFTGEDKPEQLYKRYRVLLHIAFWLAIIVYDVVIWGLVDAHYTQKLVSTLSELPIKMAAAYFTLYVLLDRLFMRNRYGRT